MCVISYIQMFKKRLVDMDCKTFQSYIPGIHLGSGEINLIPLHSMDLSHGVPRNGFYWLSFYRFSSPLRTYAQDKPLWSKVWWSNHEVLTTCTISSHHHWLFVQLSGCLWLSTAAWNKGLLRTHQLCKQGLISLILCLLALEAGN